MRVLRGAAFLMVRTSLFGKVRETMAHELLLKGGLVVTADVVRHRRSASFGKNDLTY
jgi:hypothetical protein